MIRQRHRAKCDCPPGVTCAYCGMPLAPKHEHDHMPIPDRHGGETTVPVCWNCHTLKDRMNTVEALGFGVLEAVMTETNPLIKILLTSCLAQILDLRAERDRLREELGEK